MHAIYQLLAVVAAATLTSTRMVRTSSDEEKNFELLILHNNDMHARFEQTSQQLGTCTPDDREKGKCYGGFARVAHVVKEARLAAATGTGPPVLYLNAGDTYTGSAWFTLYKWKIAAEFINAIQPDAMSLGNHEFDNGVSGLTPFIENVTCPVLTANIILTKEPTLEAEKNLMKSIVFNISGTLVGVIGYLTPDTKILAVRNNVEYIEEVDAIREEAVKLKNTGVKILIALGHSGFTKDLEIAEKVEDIDLVIGGHTNTFLWNGTTPDIETIEGPYPTLVKQKSGRLVPAVQAFAYTKYMGKLQITFDANGEIKKYSGNPILLNNSIPQDVDILRIINRYSSEVQKVSEVTAGTTSVVLEGSTCRLVECNMGNLITDAMVHKYAMEYIGDGWTDAPIAIMQGGGIRASVAHLTLPAVVTVGDLLTVMPFDGNMAKVTLNGSNVFAMLEHAVFRYTTIRPFGEFLQFSGILVEYDFSKTPGKRVVSALARCGTCPVPSFAPINKTEIYSILMPSFLSLGGDGFSVFVDLPSEALDYDELISTIDYVNKTSPVYTSTENRIIIRNADKLNSSSTLHVSIILVYLSVIYALWF